MSSLLILLDKNSSCIRRDFRVLASSEDYVLFGSGKSFSCFVTIYRRSRNCYSVICYLLRNDVCTFYRSYKSIKDLCNYLDILSSMLVYK